RGVLAAVDGARVALADLLVHQIPVGEHGADEGIGARALQRVAAARAELRRSRRLVTALGAYLAAHGSSLATAPNARERRAARRGDGWMLTRTTPPDGAADAGDLHLDVAATGTGSAVAVLLAGAQTQLRLAARTAQTEGAAALGVGGARLRTLGDSLGS